MKQQQSFIFLGASMILFLGSCKNSDTKTDSSTVAITTISADTSKPYQTPEEYAIQAVKTKPIDTLFVDVYSSGKIKVGSRDIDMDSLTNNLTDTLKSIKKRTGRLPLVIKSRNNGEVLMGIRGATHDAIDDAKKNVGFPKGEN